MKKKEKEETIVRHLYDIPKAPENAITENYRQVSVVRLNEAIHLVSSFPEENMIFLSKLAIKLMEEIKDGKEK